MSETKNIPWTRNTWDLPGLENLESEIYFIRVFIVTYNSPETVNNNLKSLMRAECLGNVRLQVNIINNHPNFNLDPEFHNQVIVHDNSLRLKTSIGHLARDYNSGIMLGFENLTEPKCHQVIICHDDVVWHPEFLNKLLDIHYRKNYTFYTGNFGCSVMSFLPEAVRKIGLFDERFCNIGFHEADYFLRALIYNREKSSINDDTHGRVVNPTEIFFDHPPYTPNKVDSREASSKYHFLTRGIFASKWNLFPDRWEENGVLDKPPLGPLIPSYFYYPRFEMELDYDTVKRQKYLVPERFEFHWYDNFAMPKNTIYADMDKLQLKIIVMSDTCRVESPMIPTWTWADATAPSILKGKVSHVLSDIDEKLAKGGSLEWLNVPI